jgi:NTP pyrophosphatase (non-canonical NTP hydrolase)
MTETFDPYMPDYMDADALARFHEFFPKTKNNPHIIPSKSKGFNDALNAAVGLAGEGAEILELYKKELWGTLKPVDREKLVKELGDLFWYFHSMLVHNEITLEEVIDGNIKKLSERYGVVE